MPEISIVFWHWWVLAIFLLVIEILVPAFFFLWLSLSGLIVGLILWFNPLISYEIQLLIFALSSITSVFIWQQYDLKHKIKTKTNYPLLNKKGSQYIGRTFVLIESIKNRKGRIKVDDTLWTVQGEDCPVGSTVEVIAVSGVLFKVKLVVS